MAGKPESRPMRQSSDPTTTPVGDPQCVETMTLQHRGGSVAVTIPSVAVKLLGYEPGEQRDVEVHEGGIWIPQGDQHGE